MRVLARFLTSATEARHFPPPSLPEIAFLGRSNVGKSSVINSLVGKKLAKTSSTPGRTRAINFFEIRFPGHPRPALIFSDLPGYGYARISKEISGEWPQFIEPYLKERPCLALCIALVDINIPPQASDQQLLEFLSATRREFLIVATKADRLSGNQLTNAMRAFKEKYGARVLPFSAKAGSGLDDLWREIRAATQGMQQLHSAGDMEPPQAV
jgi:GTP-binding protein